jgi:hypothetical protein
VALAKAGESMSNPDSKVSAATADFVRFCIDGEPGRELFIAREVLIQANEFETLSQCIKKSQKTQVSARRLTDRSERGLIPSNTHDLVMGNPVRITTTRTVFLARMERARGKLV